MGREPRHVTKIEEVDDELARNVLETIERQPTVTRELLMRRIAEAWLEGQRLIWVFFSPVRFGKPQVGGAIREHHP